MDRSVYLKFFDPTTTTYFTTIFRSFGHLLFETDHFQNVIDSVWLFESFDELKNDSNVRAFLKKMDISTLDTKGLKFAYIKPIAGGEALISFQDFELEG
jgi:hypothetical protein